MRNNIQKVLFTIKAGNTGRPGGQLGNQNAARKWKVLARHKWVSGAEITESNDMNSEDSFRRYTATIRGFRGWKIWQGATAYKDSRIRAQEIINKVITIRDRIDAGDESVFHESGAW